MQMTPNITLCTMWSHSAPAHSPLVLWNSFMASASVGSIILLLRKKAPRVSTAVSRERERVDIKLLRQLVLQPFAAESRSEF